MLYVKYEVKVLLLSHIQLLQPHGLSPPGSSVHRILRARVLEWDLPDPGIKPWSPALQGNYLLSEPRKAHMSNIFNIKKLEEKICQDE